jgi:hypothetical protein
MVSGGATSSSVEVSEALKAIGEGRSFIPDEGRNLVASFLFPHYGTYWHMENRMFYRQSMLFVQFMRDQDPAAFRRFLTAVVQGDDFKKALHRTYPDGVCGLWSKFVDEARTSASRALSGLREDSGTHWLITGIVVQGDAALRCSFLSCMHLPLRKVWSGSREMMGIRGECGG